MIDYNYYLNKVIKFERKDHSVRYAMIMLDERTNKYAFVNLTKGHNHICPCRFDSVEGAVNDMLTRDDLIGITVTDKELW